MKTSICSALAGAALLVSAGVANAGEPVALSDAQMDDVTAAGIAIGYASAGTLGDLLSETTAETHTIVFNGSFAAAEAEASGLAVSVYFPAASVSGSEAAAALP